MRDQSETIFVTRASLPPMEEYVEKLQHIWESAWLTNMGEYHEELKEELKKYLGVKGLELFVNGHTALGDGSSGIPAGRRGYYNPVQFRIHHPRDCKKQPDAGILRY